MEKIPEKVDWRVKDHHLDEVRHHSQKNLPRPKRHDSVRAWNNIRDVFQMYASIFMFLETIIIFQETIKSLLQQVLTPKAADECDIQDHFPSPIVRRAIVNRNTLCYAISMVQLLMRVPQVYSIVRSHSHKKQKANRSECFLCMLTNLISERPRADDTPAFVALLKCKLFIFYIFQFN